MDAQARAAALQGEITGHKRVIRQHRRALAEKVAELERFRDECARRGIRLVLQQKGEGEDPWPSRSSISTS